MSGGVLPGATTNLSTTILEVESWLDLSIPNIVRQLSNSIVNKHIIGKIAQNNMENNHCQHYFSMLKFKIKYVLTEYVYASTMLNNHFKYN